jgi:hypothetical protein
MSVAFELEVAPSRAVARLTALARAVPAAAAALFALQAAAGPVALLGGDPTVRGFAATLAAVLALSLGRSAIAAGRGRADPGAPAGTRLSVDADGSPALVAPGAVSARGALRTVPGPAPGAPGNDSAPAGSPPAQPLRLGASCRLPGLTLLILAPSADHSRGVRRVRPFPLLLGRDAVPDDAWRRLHAWLRWLERGRRSAPDPGPDPT